LNRAQLIDKGIDAMTCTDPPAPAVRLANEQQAIAYLKHGDMAGLAVLVQAYQVEAVHAALLITGDQGAAEEVVQEAFLQAYRKIGQFDDRRPFGPWFLRSVIHAALKAAARQKRVEPLEEPPGGSSTAEWLIDPALGPQEIAETAEASEAIWQALRQLTPDQRAAVVLHYFLDESENEMILELNRPLTTIKWWLYAARQRLRKILRPSHDSETDCQEVDRE
jgi:RNA polymerase sigma-70 factor, ECF subfamily